MKRRSVLPVLVTRERFTGIVWARLSRSVSNLQIVQNSSAAQVRCPSNTYSGRRLTTQCRRDLPSSCIPSTPPPAPLVCNHPSCLLVTHSRPARNRGRTNLNLSTLYCIESKGVPHGGSAWSQLKTDDSRPQQSLRGWLHLHATTRAQQTNKPRSRQSSTECEGHKKRESQTKQTQKRQDFVSSRTEGRSEHPSFLLSPSCCRPWLEKRIKYTTTRYR